jgi:hypothetical protein
MNVVKTNRVATASTNRAAMAVATDIVAPGLLANVHA